MKSDKNTVEQQFRERRQYRIPFYQRAYVWSRGEQWQPLWGDILEKAEARLNGKEPSPHFLGAIVLEPNQRKNLREVETFNVIDGQQRLSTLQYILAALLIVAKNEGLKAISTPLEECLWNRNLDTMERPDVEKFKVWPTFRDRADYESAITSESLGDLKKNFPDSFTQRGEPRKIGINHPPSFEAIWFFHHCIRQWISENKNHGDTALLLDVLANSVLLNLVLISIILEEGDDAQVIFETLNGRGARLHATDLIRNYIFLRADREHQDSEFLYSEEWLPFEDYFWSEGQRRGRILRPRLEWFVQTSLQSETGEEVEINNLYVGYKNYVDSEEPPISAVSQLDMLSKYSSIYKKLVTGKGDEPIAHFGNNISIWDASTLHSIACRVARSGIARDQQKEIFSYLLSYIVRRAVCGLSTKNYNNVFLQILKRLNEDPILEPSQFRKHLSLNVGEASRWPGDNEFSRAWLRGDVIYNVGNHRRMKSIFIDLENEIRPPKSEDVFSGDPGKLDIDHIMPKSWHQYWPLDGEEISYMEASNAKFSWMDRDPESDKRRDAIQRRERLIATLGNLTLIHHGVNRSLQNRGFLEKRDQFFRSSNLHLNREIMIASEWNEDSIEKRGKALLEAALRIWKSPDREED